MDTIQRWWEAEPRANLGIDCRHHPVIDCDTEDAYRFVSERLPVWHKLYPLSQTPRGGYHLHMEPHDGLRNATDVGGIKGLDLRTAGGYVLECPSTTPDGEYKWLTNPDEPLCPWSEELLAVFRERRNSQRLSSLHSSVESLATSRGVQKGSRNAVLCRLAGIELARGRDPEEVFQEALVWGNRCSPPFPESEVARTIQGLVNADRRSAPVSVSSPISFEGGSQDANAFKLRPLSDIEPEDIEWLWPGWWPLGSLCFLNGNPAAGKSWLVCYAAAIISRGGFWPCTAPCRQGKVVYATAEDTPSVIQDRIARCGGDLENVLVPECGAEGDEQALLLARYADQLDAALRDTTDVRLVVIDTISAMLPGVDFNKLEQVQRGCQVLKTLAQRHNVTVVGLHHLPKDAGKRQLIHAAAGSIGFTAAPRGAALVAVEKGTERRVLLPQKCSWSVHPQSRAFEITDSGLLWEPEPVEVSWETLNGKGGRRKTAIDEAKRWLKSRLDAGPVLVSDLRAESQQSPRDYSWRTIERAARELSVIGRGKNNERVWTLG